MTYITMEVEIGHGKIVPREPDKLPEWGRGLLIILQPVSHPTPLSQLEAFEELRKSLNWLEMIRDARR